jgi:hypothetical protein
MCRKILVELRLSDFIKIDSAFSHWYMRRDGQTDMVKRIGEFLQLLVANASNYILIIWAIVTYQPEE